MVAQGMVLVLATGRVGVLVGKFEATVAHPATYKALSSASDGELKNLEGKVREPERQHKAEQNKGEITSVLRSVGSLEEVHREQ